MNVAYQELESRAERTLSREDYERFLPLVRRIAMRFARRVPSSVLLSDLLSCGWVGLLEAFRRSREDMPVEEFEAYAAYRVRGAILDYLRGLDPSLREARNASRRIARAVATATRELGRPPEEEEVAHRMGMDIGAYQQLLLTVHRAGMARLEVLDFDEANVASDDEGPEDEATRRMIGAAVAAAIPSLPDRLRTVLGLYYQEGCTQKEIGAILGITESRVSQLHTDAIHRIRAAIGKE